MAAVFVTDVLPYTLLDIPRRYESIVKETVMCKGHPYMTSWPQRMVLSFLTTVHKPNWKKVCQFVWWLKIIQNSVTSFRNDLLAFYQLGIVLDKRLYRYIVRYMRQKKVYLFQLYSKDT